MIKDLGTGSSGSVTLVRHISMDQERALKKVPKSSAFSESALSEARLLKSLEHPSIPRIFDFEEDDAATVRTGKTVVSTAVGDITVLSAQNVLLLYRRGIYRRRDIRFIFASSAVNFPRFIF